MFEAISVCAIFIAIAIGFWLLLRITEPRKSKVKATNKVVHCTSLLNTPRKTMEVKLSDVLFAVERIAMANNANVFHVSAHMSAGYNVVFKAFIYGIGDVQGIDVKEIEDKLLAIKPIKKTVDGAATVITVKAVESTPKVEPVKPTVFTEVLVDIYK